ncbi:hypothetical protein CBS63078_9866 [Aspergillus niger]|nr:hypothetical protein CBS115989_6432 [Aspergillus niger]KAI2831197.1 hypothetical protein CBS133816_2722 [Aspergillus niger]KAI2835086.1 hypothetical protein CBS11350_10276 [Aspergillus niger]KAI2840310.1 hypothetical protein CBS11232_9125 [Aspergillus niger]KAI2845998.1 hypothetical protein CBS12448_9655 [Aspergillus niger]
MQWLAKLTLICLTTTTNFTRLAAGAPIPLPSSSTTISTATAANTHIMKNTNNDNPNNNDHIHSLLKFQWLASLLRKLSTLTLRDYFINLSVLICIIGLFALAYRIGSNTMRCQRCRVDRAAQREERKARRAYKAAARRHRWRQWWEGKTSYSAYYCQDQEVVGVDDGAVVMASIGVPERDVEMGRLSDDEEEGGAELRVFGGSGGIANATASATMHAEIQGFRQALEYVGELVRESAPSRAKVVVDQEVGGYNVDVDVKGGSGEGSDTEASSTVGLATVTLSTETSSLKSVDCKSLSGTIDTLDSMGSPPPSYHS